MKKALLFVIPGILITAFGGWAWVAYFFAGTGFAKLICGALVVGGAALAGFGSLFKRKRHTNIISRFFTKH